eukprot:ANDGO_06448.mRNA.1 5'-AMP-activated protein kinase catalytic subunit alpha-1
MSGHSFGRSFSDQIVIPRCEVSSPVGKPLTDPFATDVDVKEEDLRRSIQLALHPTLDREIWQGGRSTREKFLEWLFKLADSQEKGFIDVNDLTIILEAVERDGIRIDHLIFEGDASPQNILKEYSSSADGVQALSKSDFLVLADLVLREYESLESLHDEKIGTKPIFTILIESKVLGPIALGHKLGEGAYGVVRSGSVVESDKPLAVKLIPVGSCADMSRIDTEVAIMTRLHHENVVELYDVVVDNNFVYLCMELCGGGALSDYVSGDIGGLPSGIARWYFVQLVQGVQYCHTHGVCHRDLRLENLLLSNDGTLKITDFGQSRVFSKGWDLFSTVVTGTLSHLAPEQVEGKVFSGQAVDVWSLGIILFKLLVGCDPLYGFTVAELFANISAAKWDRSLVKDPLALDLLEKILVPDPHSRAAIDDIVAHEWFQGVQLVPSLVHYRLSFVPPPQNVSFMEDVKSSILSLLDSLNVHVHSCPNAFTSAFDDALSFPVSNSTGSFSAHSTPVTMSRASSRESMNKSDDESSTAPSPTVMIHSNLPNKSDSVGLKCFYPRESMRFFVIISQSPTPVPLPSSLSPLQKQTQSPEEKRFSILFSLRCGESRVFRKLVMKMDRQLRMILSKQGVKGCVLEMTLEMAHPPPCSCAT